jgi:TPR repeat protein
MAGVMAADIHSEMLLGYANAMYRLGWRYETGLGTGRNVEEAIRCYFKAAKLGNPAALARLAPRCAGGGAGDVTAMPEPPASPSAQAG